MRASGETLGATPGSKPGSREKGSLEKYEDLAMSCFLDPNAPPPKRKAVAAAASVLKPRTVATAVAVPMTSKVPATKAGEPSFQMDISPDVVVFNYTPMAKPVAGYVTMKNTLKEKQSFKVRCTSIEIFRVQPPMGFIAAGETMTFRIWFQNKAALDPKIQHYFVFSHKKAVTGKSIDETWAKDAKPEGVRRIAAEFVVV